MVIDSATGELRFSVFGGSREDAGVFGDRDSPQRGHLVYCAVCPGRSAVPCVPRHTALRLCCGIHHQLMRPAPSSGIGTWDKRVFGGTPNTASATHALPGRSRQSNWNTLNIDEFYCSASEICLNLLFMQGGEAQYTSSHPGINPIRKVVSSENRTGRGRE